MSLDTVVTSAGFMILISLWAMLGAPLVTFVRTRSMHATRMAALFAAILLTLFNGVFLLILLTFHYFDKVFS